MAKTGPERLPLVEWLAAIFGALVVIGMIGFLLAEGLGQRDGAPPLMRVEPLRLAAMGNQFVVEISVSNLTQKTAASVQVEGKLTRSGSDVETSTASLRYVPGESRRRAGLIFTHDPRKYRLKLRVTGYERP